MPSPYAVVYSWAASARERAEWAKIRVGRSELPGREDMEGWVEGHQEWVKGNMERAMEHGDGYQEIYNGARSRFLHGAAGTGLYEVSDGLWSLGLIE